MIHDGDYSFAIIGDDPLIALERASREGLVHEIERLVLAGADPKASCSYPLTLAAKHGHSEAVGFLIPLSSPKENFSAALCEASRNGHLDCVRLLIPVSDAKDISRAFGFAMDNGHLDVMGFLAENFSIDEHASSFLERCVGRQDSQTVGFILDAVSMTEAQTIHETLLLDGREEEAAWFYGLAQGRILRRRTTASTPRPRFSI